MLLGSVSKALVLAALVAAMATSPVDYTTFLANSVCLPLQRVTSFATSSFSTVLDWIIWPVRVVNRALVNVIDWATELSINVVIALVDMSAIGIEKTIGMLGLVIEMGTRVFRNFMTCVQSTMRLFLTTDQSVLDKIVSSFIDKTQFYLTLVLNGMCYLVNSIILQTIAKYVFTWAFWTIGCILRTPFSLFQSCLDISVCIIMRAFAFPFDGILFLVNYLVYTGLYPYVYMVYASVGTGLAVLILPELIRNYNIQLTDLRTILRRIGYTGNDVSINRGGVSAVLNLLENRAQTSTQVECVVCYNIEFVYTLQPCGHDKVCYSCLTQIQNINNKCPICRKEIHSFSLK